MAKNVLPVDFQDDILAEEMDGRRKYQMITNPDGTVSFVDVTEYTQVGSNFGQAQINATNEAVNESADKNKIIDSKADLMANTQAGMMAGAVAVKEAVTELTENMGSVGNMKIFSSWADNNIITFRLKRPTSTRYTCFLCLMNQNAMKIGAYMIGVTPTKEAVVSILGSEATISRNGDNVTVTFTGDSGIYSNALIIIPQSLA